MPRLVELVTEIEKASKGNDPKALRDACTAFTRQLPHEPGTLETPLARKVLKILRGSRSFEHMRVVAQAIINDGCDDAQVSRQYAQTLIEAGETKPAIGILNEIIASENTEPAELDEAKGGLGRAWKDVALATRGIRDKVAAEALKKAYKSYRDVYAKDPAALYQGINSVALAAWDRGLALSPEEVSSALKSANDILEAVKNSPAEKRESWDIATAAEALIALGKLKEAATWFKDYVLHKDTNAFALGSTVRQLTEVWKLGDTEEGSALLAPLRARLCMLPGGNFTISSEDVLQMATVSKADYERVLGNIGPKTYTWMQTGFDIAKSVALIRHKGRGFGTGFLVKGSDLDDRLGGELFVVTNAHVTSDPPQEKAVHPEDVTVSFELAPPEANPKQIYVIGKIVWQSPPNQHDVSLLRLSPSPPATLKPMKLSKQLPILDENEKQRLYIIGYPGGGEISFSFEDNELLDYETKYLKSEDDPSPCRVHYRTPTEGGSSGSPVFNANWLTIAIHHRGSKEMLRLNNKGGEYAANEGIWIQSIRRAIAKSKDLTA